MPSVHFVSKDFLAQVGVTDPPRTAAQIGSKLTRDSDYFCFPGETDERRAARRDDGAGLSAEVQRSYSSAPSVPLERKKDSPTSVFDLDEPPGASPKNDAHDNAAKNDEAGAKECERSHEPSPFYEGQHVWVNPGKADHPAVIVSVHGTTARVRCTSNNTVDEVGVEELASMSDAPIAKMVKRRQARKAPEGGEDATLDVPITNRTLRKRKTPSGEKDTNQNLSTASIRSEASHNDDESLHSDGDETLTPKHQKQTLSGGAYKEHGGKWQARIEYEGKRRYFGDATSPWIKWTCHRCHRENLHTKARCPGCKSWKGGKRGKKGAGGAGMGQASARKGATKSASVAAGSKSRAPNDGTAAAAKPAAGKRDAITTTTPSSTPTVQKRRRPAGVYPMSNGKWKVEVSYKGRSTGMGCSFGTIEQAAFVNAYAREMVKASKNLQLTALEIKEDIYLIKREVAEALRDLEERARAEMKMLEGQNIFERFGVREMPCGTWEVAFSGQRYRCIIGTFLSQEDAALANAIARGKLANKNARKLTADEIRRNIELARDAVSTNVHILTEGSEALLREESEKSSSTMPALAIATWVQCENPNCLKWRKLPCHVDVDLLPEKFFCKDNIWNPKSQTCDAEEDEWDVDDKPIKFDTCIDIRGKPQIADLSGEIIQQDKSLVNEVVPNAKSSIGAQNPSGNAPRYDIEIASEIDATAKPPTDPPILSMERGSEKQKASELETYMETCLSRPENTCNMMPSLEQKEKMIDETDIEKKRLEGWLSKQPTGSSAVNDMQEDSPNGVQEAVERAAQGGRQTNSSKRWERRKNEEAVALFSQTVSELVNDPSIRSVSDLPDLYDLGKIMRAIGFSVKMSFDEILQNRIRDVVIMKKRLSGDDDASTRARKRMTIQQEAKNNSSHASQPSLTSAITTQGESSSDPGTDLAGHQEAAPSPPSINTHQTVEDQIESDHASVSSALAPPSVDESSEDEVWLCEICHTATFASYEETVEHERGCVGKPRTDFGDDTSSTTKFVAPSSLEGEASANLEEGPLGVEKTTRDGIASVVRHGYSDETDTAATSSPKSEKTVESMICLTRKDAPWFYIDLQGSTQGPFTSKQMRHWSEGGHLSGGLRISQARAGPFYSLYSYFPDRSLAFASTSQSSCAPRTEISDDNAAEASDDERPLSPENEQSAMVRDTSGAALGAPARGAAIRPNALGSETPDKNDKGAPAGELPTEGAGADLTVTMWDKLDAHSQDQGEATAPSNPTLEIDGDKTDQENDTKANQAKALDLEDDAAAAEEAEVAPTKNDQDAFMDEISCRIQNKASDEAIVAARSREMGAEKEPDLDQTTDAVSQAMKPLSTPQQQVLQQALQQQMQTKAQLQIKAQLQSQLQAAVARGEQAKITSESIQVQAQAMVQATATAQAVVADARNRSGGLVPMNANEIAALSQIQAQAIFNARSKTTLVGTSGKVSGDDQVQLQAQALVHAHTQAQIAEGIYNRGDALPIMAAKTALPPKQPPPVQHQAALAAALPHPVAHALPHPNPVAAPAPHPGEPPRLPVGGAEAVDAEDDAVIADVVEVALVCLQSRTPAARTEQEECKDCRDALESAGAEETRNARNEKNLVEEVSNLSRDELRARVKKLNIPRGKVKQDMIDALVSHLKESSIGEVSTGNAKEQIGPDNAVSESQGSEVTEGASAQTDVPVEGMRVAVTFEEGIFTGTISSVRFDTEKDVHVIVIAYDNGDPAEELNYPDEEDGIQLLGIVTANTVEGKEADQDRPKLLPGSSQPREDFKAWLSDRKRKWGRVSGEKKLLSDIQKRQVLDKRVTKEVPKKRHKPSKRVVRKFSDRVADLKAYKAKHGHLDVRKKEDKTLATFCCNVRQARRNFINGRNWSGIAMTEDRMAALDAIGFDWREKEESSAAPALDLKTSHASALAARQSIEQADDSQERGPHPNVVPNATLILTAKKPAPPAPKDVDTAAAQQSTAAPNNDPKCLSRPKFLASALVDVQARTWPGRNDLGGVARITQIHPGSNFDDGVPRYDVRYAIDTRREKKIEEHFLSLHEEYVSSEKDLRRGPGKRRVAPTEKAYEAAAATKGITKEPRARSKSPAKRKSPPDARVENEGEQTSGFAEVADESNASNDADIAEDFSQLSRDELRAKLKELNIPQGRTKQDMIDTLTRHLHPNENGSVSEEKEREDDELASFAYKEETTGPRRPSKRTSPLKAEKAGSGVTMKCPHCLEVKHYSSPGTAIASFTNHTKACSKRRESKERAKSEPEEQEEVCSIALSGEFAMSEKTAVTSSSKHVRKCDPSLSETQKKMPKGTRLRAKPLEGDMVLSLKNPKYKEVMFETFQSLGQRTNSDENERLNELKHELFATFKKGMGDGRFLKSDRHMNEMWVADDSDALAKIVNDLKRRNESSKHWMME